MAYLVLFVFHSIQSLQYVAPNAIRDEVVMMADRSKPNKATSIMLCLYFFMLV